MGIAAIPEPGGGFRLLGADEPAPVLVTNDGAASAFLILCDHAGRRIPQRLGQLGLPPSELDRHIAWDIGIQPMGQRLGALLGATVIEQRYSRLVVDCNRHDFSPGLMPAVSDATVVPGNAAIPPEQRAARLSEIYHPYHDRIAEVLDLRAATGRHTVLLSLHSFTPVFGGVARPWHGGVLHADNSAFSRAVLHGLRAEAGLLIGDNQPYRMDPTDYTVPRHAKAHGLDYLELEVRQDLIATEPGQVEWADRMARLLPRALADIGA